jgi:hypothetical protein
MQSDFLDNNINSADVSRNLRIIKELREGLELNDIQRR